VNCSLALAATNTFLRRASPGNEMNADDVYRGVTNLSWPGRFETLEDGNSVWYLDGAHNGLSVKHAAEWFAKKVNVSKKQK
jgi:folylpolyglutamate synthase